MHPSSGVTRLPYGRIGVRCALQAVDRATMLRRLSSKKSQGSAQGPEVAYQQHQKENPAATAMPSAYTKKVLDNRALALFDEIALDRQISRSNSGEQVPPSPEKGSSSQFSALSDEDREMAAWLADQGVDVSHIGGTINGTGVSEEPQPTAALMRARRASGAGAGAPAPAPAEATPEDDHMKKLNHTFQLSWLSSAEAEADESAEAVARRRMEKAKQTRKSKVEVARTQEAIEKDARAQEAAIARAKAYMELEVNQKEVMAAKALAAAEEKERQQLIAEAKAKEAAKEDEGVKVARMKREEQDQALAEATKRAKELAAAQEMEAKGSVAAAKAREAAELAEWKRKAAEAKAKEAKELEEWKMRAAEAKAKESQWFSSFLSGLGERLNGGASEVPTTPPTPTIS